MIQLMANTSRAEILESLRRNPETTFLVVGGGIHGLEFARMAARNGQACVLAERSDYASGTSSRSSKMAHGGLRYLGMLDFQQVREGLLARDDLYTTARHLCKAAPFLVPVPRGDLWFRLKLGTGLALYDRMGANRSPRHRYIPRKEVQLTGVPADDRKLDGWYEYWDGLIFDDARLVLESMLDATRNGARCLNYLEVDSISRVGTHYSVLCKDRLGGGAYEVTTDLVINCAGPWVPAVGGGAELADRLKFSVGVHLLFDRPWPNPCLFLPLPEPGRYYFVWPHPSGGTMVGTTEREVDFPVDFDPGPTDAEVEEILDRLRNDLPDSGLDRTTLYHGFAGIRALPLRGRSAAASRLSRRHVWMMTEQGLALLGGKLTTAKWTAWEGYRRATAELGLPTGESLVGIPYPGSGTDSELREAEQELICRGVPDNEARRLVARLGVRSRLLLEREEFLEPITKNLYRGEVTIAVRDEQAMTVEDVLRRRTGIEFDPGPPAVAIAGVIPYVARERDLETVQTEALAYGRRLEVLRHRLKAGFA